MQLLGKCLRDLHRHPIALCPGFETVTQWQAACRSDLELIRKLLVHRIRIDLQFQRLVRKIRRGLGIFKRFVPLLESHSINDMLWDTLPIEGQ